MELNLIVLRSRLAYLIDVLTNHTPCGQLNQFIVVMRHGDRADDTPDTEATHGRFNACDPPLSEKGHETATKSCAHVMSYLNTAATSGSTLFIASSPFERCIQTAEHFQGPVKLVGENSLWESWVHLRKVPMTPSDIVKHVTSNVQQKQIPAQGLPPPSTETADEASVRYLKSVQSIADNYGMHEHGDVVIVTHGEAVRAVVEGVNDWSVTPYAIDYCGYALLRRDVPGMGAFQLCGTCNIQVMSSDGENLRPRGDLNSNCGVARMDRTMSVNNSLKREISQWTSLVLLDSNGLAGDVKMELLEQLSIAAALVETYDVGMVAVEEVKPQQSHQQQQKNVKSNNNNNRGQEKSSQAAACSASSRRKGYRHK
eukprot:PhF_6_TR23982/c0_g1_i1/m.33583